MHSRFRCYRNPDTGGATDQVFDLLALLGFRFAPRLRDLKDRRLYAFRGQAVPEVLDSDA